MKFKDVREGDTVYVRVSERSDTIRKWFWMLRTVTRVTPTQFTVERVRYNKKSGNSIGGSYYNQAAPIKERTELLPNGVIDQTEERDIFMGLRNTVIMVRAITSKFRVKYDHPKLLEIHALLLQADALRKES